MSKPTRPVLLVDGLNFFMRHFVANPSMSQHGNHVGGFVGFLKGLGRLCDRIGPSKIIVVWEGGGSPRRRSIFKDYKEKRRPQKLNRYYQDDIPDTTQNRDNQITKIIEALNCVPTIQMYVNDCEADDIIGYLVKYALKDEKCVIVSSDKDLYQLLSPRVVQWSPGQKKYITIKTLVEKFGISASNFCTARAFIGDSSDKIDGVPRAGFASLSKRFPALSSNEFISVEDLIRQAEENFVNKKLKLYENMIEYRSTALRNWKLMYLDIKNLSASQIDKVEYSLQNNKSNNSKLQLVKMLLREGVPNFDADSFYTSVKASTVKNK